MPDEAENPSAASPARAGTNAGIGGALGTFLTWLAVSAVVAAALIGLASIYNSRLPQMVTQTDTWFGADVDRHVFWMTLEYPRRAHLHPLSFLYFRECARLIRLLGIDLLRHRLICAALPVIVPFSLAVTAAAAGLSGALRPANSRRTRAGRWALALLILLTIGPAIIFGAIGETHALGGAALIGEATLVLTALRRRPNAVRLADACERGAVICAAVSVGLTLTNVVPAAFLLLPIFRRRLIPWVIAVLVALAGLELWLAHSYDFAIIVGNNGGLRGGAAYEASYLQMPNVVSLRQSVYHVVIAGFGTPNTHFVPVLSESPLSSAAPTDLGIYLTAGPTVLQIAATVLWLCGVGVWFAGERGEGEKLPPEANVSTLCLIALIPMLIFHASYDIGESYLFSPDIWPLIVVPGLLAVFDERASPRRSIYRAALLGALLLSGVQSAIYTPRLIGSLHPPVVGQP